MEIVVVNDTNIFIDLISIDLLDEFFQLPITIHTNDFVINELTDTSQRDKVLSYHPLNLYIKIYSAKEVAQIADFHQTHNNISFQDCSVWLYAKQNSYRLLTGDNKLRKSAIASGTAVSGILYILDLMIESTVINPKLAYLKLKKLSTINKRLPSEEIKKRLANWIDKSSK